jgi:very-short-patch-repair endonuclease
MRRQIFNSTSLKPRRKQLRNRATDTEKILWSCIKNSNLGFKFVRQYSVEGYVIDFYCPQKRLAIELDGGVHQLHSQQIYDHYRTKLLNAWGIKLIRFHNEDIKNNLTQCLKAIKQHLKFPLLN